VAQVSTLKPGYDATGRFETSNYHTLEVSCLLRKMKDTEVLSKLEEITQQLGLDLRWEDGHFTVARDQEVELWVFLVLAMTTATRKSEILRRRWDEVQLEGAKFLFKGSGEQKWRFKESDSDQSGGRGVEAVA